MRLNVLLGRTFALACAAALWSCGGDKSPLSPSSVMHLTAPSSGLSVGAQDDEPPPDPAPVPDPDPAPAPPVLTISIVGSFGSYAFIPNPILASVGDMIVWTNSDTTTHRIVLDDGTVIGDVAPGLSSAPMSVTSLAATYRCTIHPTMVGSINDATTPEPPPPPPDDYYRH